MHMLHAIAAPEEPYGLYLTHVASLQVQTGPQTACYAPHLAHRAR